MFSECLSLSQEEGIQKWTEKSVINTVVNAWDKTNKQRQTNHNKC